MCQWNVSFSFHFRIINKNILISFYYYYDSMCFPIFIQLAFFITRTYLYLLWWLWMLILIWKVVLNEALSSFAIYFLNFYNMIFLLWNYNESSQYEFGYFNKLQKNKLSAKKYTPPKKYSSTWDSTCDISLFWVPIFIILCLL